MCLAIPGKIVKIEGNQAVVDYDGEQRTADMLEKCEIGDYVIVQNKIIIKKIPADEALESIEEWKND